MKRRENRPRLVSGRAATDDQRRRPDPARWIWYTFGGSLRARYRGWVLHDLTSRSRWLRQAARAMVQVAPLEVVLLLVLGFGWITYVALVGGLVMALIYSLAYFDQSTDNRLVKHGYLPGTAGQIRRERERAKDPDAMRRYLQTYRGNAN
jgi:fatty acid desaturase